MSVEERERSLERLGLNDPIYVQYVRWVENAAQGDFGISYQYKQPVLEVLEGRMGNTVLLGGTGFLLTFALALLVGVFCAWQEERWPDRILCKIGTLTSCIPEFWLCLLFILVFSASRCIGCPAAALTPPDRRGVSQAASSTSSSLWRSSS